MSTMPQRQYGVLIAIGLVVVGAAIAGVVLFTSGRASEVELTTASLVPEDAAFYVAFNTNLASNQWVAAFKLAERLGQENPQQELRDSAESEGVDWEKDVAPFLGGNAAFYLRGFDIERFDVQGAAIVRCKDAGRALDVIREQSGADFVKSSYRGVTYYDGDGLLVGRIGQHLVLAIDQQSMEEVIDVSEGKRPSLAGLADFKSLRDELTNNFLAFVYMDASEFANGLFGGEADLRAALEKSGAGDLALKPGAAVLGAKGEGFEFQAAAVGDAGSVSPMLEPRTPKFAAMVPADVSIFISTRNIAQTWAIVKERSGSDLDTYFRDEGRYRSLDDALRSAGEDVGLENIEELIKLFSGETALAARFTSTDEDDVEAVLLAEVKDEAEARRVLTTVAGSAPQGRVRKETVNGVEMSFVTDKDGEQLGFAVTDGTVVFGTETAARRVVAKDFGNNLAGSSNFQKSVKQMPTALGSFAYFDLATLLRLTAGGVPANLDKAEQALRGAIINMVEERGVARLSGVITIAEK